MTTDSASQKLRDLPKAIALAIGLIVTHIMLYIKGIILALNNGATFDPRWVLHVLVIVYLITQIPKRRVGLFCIISAYCIYISTKWLLDDHSTGTIILSLPLYLAVVCMAASYPFYFGKKPQSNGS